MWCQELQLTKAASYQPYSGIQWLMMIEGHKNSLWSLDNVEHHAQCILLNKYAHKGTTSTGKPLKKEIGTTHQEALIGEIQYIQKMRLHLLCCVLNGDYETNEIIPSPKIDY